MTSIDEGLAGAAALVTGATSGLGRAVALRLAAGGANVALLGRSQQDLDDVAEQIETTGLRALPIQVDLAHAASLGEVVDRAERELGKLSVLVNAAGTDVPRLWRCKIGAGGEADGTLQRLALLLGHQLANGVRDCVRASGLSSDCRSSASGPAVVGSRPYGLPAAPARFSQSTGKDGRFMHTRVDLEFEG